jgi:hypothetical protein
MPTLMPCPMPTCGAPIDAVHLVPQGMGAFTYVIRCDCGLSFDTGAQSEAAAADRWNERPAPKPAETGSLIAEQWAFQQWILSCPKDPLHWDTWMARAKLNGAPK